MIDFTMVSNKLLEAWREHPLDFAGPFLHHRAAELQHVALLVGGIRPVVDLVVKAHGSHLVGHAVVCKPRPRGLAEPVGMR